MSAYINAPGKFKHRKTIKSSNQVSANNIRSRTGPVGDKGIFHTLISRKRYNQVRSRPGQFSGYVRPPV